MELDYVDMVMTSMNFPMKWKTWILTCLSSASASILVNGFSIDEFLLSRRQGEHYDECFGGTKVI